MLKLLSDTFVHGFFFVQKLEKLLAKRIYQEMVSCWFFLCYFDFEI